MSPLFGGYNIIFEFGWATIHLVATFNGRKDSAHGSAASISRKTISYPISYPF